MNDETDKVKMTMISIILQMVALMAFFYCCYYDNKTIKVLERNNEMLRIELANAHQEGEYKEIKRRLEEDCNNYRTEYKTVFLGWTPNIYHGAGGAWKKGMEQNDNTLNELLADGWEVAEKQFINTNQSVFWVMILKRYIANEQDNNQQ